MEVVARQLDLTDAPKDVAFFATTGQIFVTVGTHYEVHAVSVFQGVVFVQVVDDLSYPAWLPAWLFDRVDAALPDDWICNMFRDQPTLLLGPEFIAQDQSAYTKMVELEPQQVQLFRERIERQRSSDVREES